MSVKNSPSKNAQLSTKANGDEIVFRPHHFVCTLGFLGKGYSPEFVENYQKIVDKLNADPETPIRATDGQDSVCSACPKRVTDSICTSQDVIDKLDAGYKKLLPLEDGETLKWSEAKDRIRENVTLEDFKSICHICGWFRAGVCEKALKKLGVRKTCTNE